MNEDLLARIDRLESLDEIRQLPAKYALSLDMRDLDAHVNLFAAIRQKFVRARGMVMAVAKAVEAGDCVLLGDLLEYELAPRAEAEAKIVALLRRHADTPSG